MPGFIGILPAGGTGSRLQPLRYPKELLPIGYRWSADGTELIPTLAIDHGLNAMRQAGVEFSIIVISESKPEVLRYLGNGCERGLRLAYVVQPAPKGLAHAVDQAAQWAGRFDSNVSMVMPDTYFEPEDALRLVNERLVSEQADLVLGVFPTERPESLGPVRMGPGSAVEAVYDKPKTTDLKNTWAMAAWSPRFSRLLHQQLLLADESEVILGKVFDLACRRGLRVLAVSFPDQRFHDIGTREGLAGFATAEARGKAATPVTIAPGKHPLPNRRPARRHLLVALHDRSWGRTEMALRVACDLRDAGDDVHLVAHDATMPILEGSGFHCDRVTNHLGGLTRLLLDSCVRRVRPDSIIYFDFFNTSNYLFRMGVRDTGFLLNYECATITLDTWDHRRTGHWIDSLDGRQRSLLLGDVEKKIEEFERISHRLIPVPVAPFDHREGKFACLPVIGDQPLTFHRRGASGNERTVLFCTAGWQHGHPSDTSVQRLADQVPRLVAEYLRRLPATVNLVHVGPRPYALEDVLGNRYRYQPPLPPAEFDRLLGRSDLLISANVSATTIGKAIQMRVPVLVLKNSYTVHEAGDGATLFGRAVPPEVRSFLSGAAPVYPFALWPLGYHRFLYTLLESNPYCAAFDSVELLEADQVVERCSRLLADRAARDDMAGRQQCYVEMVRRLPTAAEMVHGFLN